MATRAGGLLSGEALDSGDERNTGQAAMDPILRGNFKLGL